MFDFIMFIYNGPWWYKVLFGVTIAIMMFFWDLIGWFMARILMPKIVQRWGQLATVPDINKASKNVIDTLSAKLPTVLSEAAVAQIIDSLPRAGVEARANLAAQIKQLRKEKADLEKEWINIGVHVRGYKLEDADLETYYAVVQINPRKGTWRGHPDISKRYIVPSKLLKDYDNPFKCLGINPTGLGAPGYAKASPTSVIMLDEAYRLYK